MDDRGHPKEYRSVVENQFEEITGENTSYACPDCERGSCITYMTFHKYVILFSLGFLHITSLACAYLGLSPLIMGADIRVLKLECHVKKLCQAACVTNHLTWKTHNH